MRRIMTLLTVTCTLLLLTAWLFSPYARADAAQVVAGYSTGFAHGAYATIPANSSSNTSATALGPIAPVWGGCDTASSVTRNNSSASASLSTLTAINSTQNSVTTQRSATAVVGKATSIVQGVNILNGLITAGNITTVANSTGTATNATSDEAGSQITALDVAGVPISALPAPNTTIQLPGVGYVVLNEIVGPYNGFSASSISVNMIHVHLTSSTISGTVANTDIIIGHASSNFFRTSLPDLVNAHSYALGFTGSVNGNTVGATPVALTEVGCASGSALSNVNNSSISGVGTTGAANDASSAQIGSPTTNVTGIANVANVNLLNGLIQGPVITSTAKASWNGKGSGSLSLNLSNLKIGGVTLASSPRPNTRVNIAGLGYVIVNEQSSSVTASSVSESMNALDLVVTVSNNSYGLSAGSQLIVGYASANITNY